MTGDVPEQGLFPFQTARPVLRIGGRVELLIFDTAWDTVSASDRWVVVKVLDQFGRWSGLRHTVTTVPAFPLTRERSASGNGYVTFYEPPLPTYDWSRAHYRSRYVVIAHYTVQNRPNAPLRKLPGRLAQLLARYSHLTQSYAFGGVQSPWPVVAVGGYAMHGALTDPFSTGFYGANSVPLASNTFAGLQGEIRQGQAGLPSGLSADFNGTVNGMIALICHADSRRPAKVCRRPAIRMLLGRVR